MNAVATAIEQSRNQVDAAASQFLADLCDIVEITLQDDEHSGQKPKETVIASNLPCRYDEVAGAAGQIVAGGVTYTASHRLTFGASETTMAIEPTQMLRVQARGDKPVMYFEQPMRAKGSMAVFVRVLAKFTTGFRQPANV